MIGNIKNNIDTEKEHKSSKSNLSKITDELEVEMFKFNSLKECTREQHLSNMIKKSPSIRTHSARDVEFRQYVNSK